MAAHTDITDYQWHKVTLTSANTAYGIDGPAGAQIVEVYNTDTVAALIQTGGQSDLDGTNIATAGNCPPVPASTHTEENCSPQDSPMIGSPQRVSVYLQSPTAGAIMQVRFARQVRVRGA